MAGKQSSIRRVSTSTIPPTAPRTSSSHRNRNRSWPGVPKRYSTMSGPSVMRPKSIATVVPVLVLTGPGKSTPRLSTVMSASVVSGSISEIVPTSVVLPTAYPPATTIFIETGRPDAPSGAVVTGSECTDALQEPFEQPHVAVLGAVLDVAHGREVCLHEVADQ